MRKAGTFLRLYKATAIHYHVLVERKKAVFLESLEDLQLLNTNSTAHTKNLSMH